MPMSSSRWSALTQTIYQRHLDALGWLREQLPDHDPWRVWSAFEFIAEDGTINAVDALVLSPAGLFLIEIEGRSGLLEGDSASWSWSEKGRTNSEDSPRLRTERKAGRFASLLGCQPAIRRSKGKGPEVEALVFLPAPEVTCRRRDAARLGVCLRGQPGALGDDGLVAVLGGTAGDERRPIDPASARAIVRAVGEAGLRPIRGQRRIGTYELGRLLQEGDSYQDWEARHVGLAGTHRRIRLYPCGVALTPEQRRGLTRAASKEYEILETLDHQGVLRVREFTETEYGPALIFDHDREAVRFDHFLKDRGDTLDIGLRLALLRQLAETIRYAHDRRIYHRALSPASILVRDPENRQPRLQVFNWQTALRVPLGEAGSGESGGGGTLHRTISSARLIDHPELVYRAPEDMLPSERRGAPLDVFSLGAIAYHLFAGRPPAADGTELAEKLLQGKGLRVSDVVDGTSPSLQDMILKSTAPRVGARLPSVEKFLEYLADVETDLTAPTPERFADPISAIKDERLEGGFTVLGRLGKGSTAVALLVRRDGGTDERVLKVALDQSLNDRLRREAETLRRLRRHPKVIEFFDVMTVGGRTALLMARAGDRTLRERLDEGGRLGLDLLERFGEDLLSIVKHLEEEGIAHRDIKPANIGVAKLGQNDRLGLVLFDFSLSGTRPEDIGAGTRPYLDPFLRLRPPPIRWDLAAERFAAAMTLFEMATGKLPVWGDGESDPAVIEVEATVDANLFDPAIRDDLAAFFRKALERDARRRHDNAEEMVRAWRRVFEATRRSGLDAAARSQGPFEAVVHQLRRNSAVVELGFSDAAVSVLDGLGIHSVADLLAVNRITFRYLRNVSERVRREIRETAKELAKRRPDLGTLRDRDAAGDDAGSIDALAERLLPRRGFAEESSTELPVLDLLLGLDGLGSGAEPVWRGLGEATKLAGRARTAVADALVQAREHWRGLKPFTGLRDDMAAMVRLNGGVMSADELSAALLVARGSVEPEPRRRILAATVVRAGIEAESGLEKPRLRLFFPAASRALIAESEPLADYAAALGRTADALAQETPLPAPAAVLERLRRVLAPDGLAPLPDRRLCTLAAAASTGAALSSRLELYPIGLAAGTALELAAGSLLGPRSLTVAQIRERVEGRFGRAHPLPERPELDRLLTAAGLDLVWDAAADEERGAYVPSAIAGAGTGSGASRRFSTTGGGTEEPSPAVSEARAFDRRLSHSLDTGGFLALTVPYRRSLEAERALQHPRFGVTRVSIDDVLIETLREEAAALGADWQTVLRADATEPASLDWRRLAQLVRRCAPKLERQVASQTRPVLLSDAGPIGRYGLMEIIERLRDSAGRPGGPPALWLLLPAEGILAAPMIDNAPVPITGSSQWARIPDSWLAGRHLEA